MFISKILEIKEKLEHFHPCKMVGTENFFSFIFVPNFF